MSNPTYTVTVTSAATDGTNIFLEVSITDGTNTMPLIRPIFAVGTPASTITAYLQAIATGRPVLTSDISGLVGTTYTG